MIDTDKYEGHTPNGWYVDDAMDVIHPTVIHSNETDNIIAELVMANAEEWTEEDYANARLIADAPLLLEEVKRHRPPKVDGKYMAWSDSHPKHDRRTWIEQVMEGITDVGYWTWVNWQLQYGDEEE